MLNQFVPICRIGVPGSVSAVGDPRGAGPGGWRERRGSGRGGVADPPGRARAATRTGLRETIERELRDDRWQPGERLPTERALAERYGVARNTVRRALEALEGEEADRPARRSWHRQDARGRPV